MCWGLGVAYFFTHKIDLSSKIAITQILGNTVILWLLLKGEKI